MNRKISFPSASGVLPSSWSEVPVESGTIPGVRATVLIVDDDKAIVAGYGRVLASCGYNVFPACSASRALELLDSGREFDVILSDLMMPDMDGVALLREIRVRNRDVPVILVTGHPSFDTAVSAMHCGSFRYLSKPVDSTLLVQAVNEAVSLHQATRIKREALSLFAAHEREQGDLANLEARFERALDRLWIAFQPIVDWKNRSLFGYEALVRSREAALGSPALLIDAAQRLHRVEELGRRIRNHAANHLLDAPDGVSIFVNLHTSDLEDPDLFDPSADLSQHAHRVVLEVTERSSLDDVRDLSLRIKALRALGYRVAVDDLGAGYAGLSSFHRLEPDIAKLDMSLIHGIDACARMQSLVRSMLNVCNSELGIRVVCEGVETSAERDVLVSLGADLIQGNLIGLPAPAFPGVQLSRALR